MKGSKRVQRMLVQAMVEPPWLEGCPKDLGKWAELLDTIQALALRSAALESLMEACHAVPELAYSALNA